MAVILMLLFHNNGGVLDNTVGSGCNTNVVITMVVFLVIQVVMVILMLL